MKRIVLSVIAICVIMACKTPPPLAPVEDERNPGVGPKLTVNIPPLFSPSPDIVDDTITITITVTHPVEIKDWDITIQPMRQRLTPEQLTQMLERRESGQRLGLQRQRHPFFEQVGEGTPPTEWKWNGKSSSHEGEMVQSATAYQFVLSVTDIYGNSTIYDEKVIEVDVIVRKDGDKLRIVVPSITFQADSSNFSQIAGDLTEEAIASNRRVLRLIANALAKYPEYKITIEGHANPVYAPNTRNHRNAEPSLKTFSEERAKAVGEYLADNHNINRSRLTYVGMGSDRVVIGFNEDSEEKWKNRRVEFILDK